MAHEYIGLPNLISLLGGEKGKPKRGKNGMEHLCLCPVHGDRKASLSVVETNDRILMKCLSHDCSTEAICDAIGIKVTELFREPMPENAKPARKSTAGRKKATPPPPPEEPAPAKTYGSYAEAYGYLGKLVCCYPYRDSNGRLMYEVARIMQKDGEKTFRQHRPVKPDGSGKCTFPIRLDVPAAMRESLIYRQREIEDAVAAGEAVYIVEGEKDADTMAKLGLHATTNSGGGGKERWKDGHTAHFKGAAEVFILPDNDATGEGHAQEVYKAVAKVAKAVYIIRLVEGYGELPPKGDFTDLAALAGTEKAVEILHRLEAEARESLWQRAQRAYADIPGYGIDEGRTCQFVDGVPKQLCNFVALPTEIVETDNGLTVEKSMKIAGWNLFGRPLRPVMVPMSKFKTMDWALESWDVEANIMPGNTVRDKLRWVMTEAAFRTATRKTVYSHCGWRQIDGKWVYLHQGGCIGAEGINVDMGNELAGYTLSGYPEGMTEVDAAVTSYSLTLNIPAQISVPLLGITYLAPLCEFMEQMLCPPSFITALIGRHGSHKTSIASLFLNHFGRFGLRGMPQNFTSTVNAVRNAAFAAKDTVLLIDDFFPQSGAGLQEVRKMNNMMQLLSRAFGDKANRNRLNADLSTQAAKPSRGIALITGENVPDIGGSGQARMYIISLDKGSYTYSDDMDRLRQDAEDGALRLAMASYIEWLLPQANELPARLRDMFTDYRRKAHKLIAGAATNDRADDAAAHIMLGLTVMLEWMEHLGLMEGEAVEAQLTDWWSVVLSNIRQQGAEGRDESPVSMFLTATREMLISGAIAVTDISDPDAKKGGTGKSVMVGYCDTQNYYFLPDQLIGEVTRFYNNQNRVFPLTKNALFKIMKDDGVVEQWDERSGRTTRQKNINGRNYRYLWIPRWRIDGKQPAAEQVKMDFREVDDKEVPEEWKE